MLPTPNPATNRQVPDAAIMDLFGKQAYLGNQFVVSGAIALGDTSEDNFLYISNAAANTKALFSPMRSFTVSDPTIAVTFRIYANPTVVAAGSIVIPVNCRLANPLTSVSVCRTAPTASTKGTLISTLVVSGGALQAVSNLMLIVDPGKSLLVTAQAASGTPGIAGEAVWWEI